jgi:hypothetical protein
MGAIGSGYIVQFSDSRLERIGKAQSLEDAQKMGWFDSLKDMFRGGVKRRAIEEAYRILHADDNTKEAASKADDHLAHFLRLRLAFKPKYANKCKVEVDVDRHSGEWGYKIVLPERLSQFPVERRGLKIGNGQALASFQDMEMISKLTARLCDPANPIKKDAAVTEDPGQGISSLVEALTAHNLTKHTAEELFSVKSILQKLEIIAKHLPDFTGEYLPTVQARLETHTNRFEAERLNGTDPHIAIELDAKTVLARAPVSTVEDVTDAWAATAAVKSITMPKKIDNTPLAAYAQSMVDGEENLENFMRNVLTNPKFNNTAYIKEDAPDGATFTARFVDQTTQMESAVELSNREGVSGHEFRGANLRAALSERKYGSFEQLLEQVRGSRADEAISYELGTLRSSIKGDVLAMLTDIDYGQYPLDLEGGKYIDVSDKKQLFEARSSLLLSVAHAIAHKLEPVVLYGAKSTTIKDFLHDWIPIELPSLHAMGIDEADAKMLLTQYKEGIKAAREVQPRYASEAGQRTAASDASLDLDTMSLHDQFV